MLIIVFMEGRFVKKTTFTVIVIMLLSALTFAKPLEVWLTGLTNEELSIFREMSADYTKKYGVEVVFSNLSWGDFESRFILAAASGETPDVGGMGPLFAPELGLRGAIIDLKTTFADFNEVYSRIAPNFFKSLTYKGAYFGIPYNANVTVAFQRNDILAQIGTLDIKTWDEMRSILPKTQSKGSNMALQWGLTENVYADLNMFMWQNGADDYIDNLTKSGFDSPASINAFKEYVDLYNKYKIPKDIPFFQAFSTGELFYMLQYQNMYTNLRTAAPQLNGKWSMVQVPGTTQGKEINRAASAGGAALTIFKNSRMKNEAWNFIKWMTEEKTQAEFAKLVMAKIPGSIFVPANRQAVLKLDMPKEDLQLMLGAMDAGSTSTYGLVAPKLRRRYLQFAAQEAILQGVDAETAIRKAASEHNSEIKKKEKEYARFIETLLKEQSKNKK